MSQLDPSQLSRRQQIAETYRITREADPTIGLKLIGTFVVAAAVGFVLGWLLPPSSGVFNWVWAAILGLLVGVVVTLFLFSRVAQRAAYSRIEGQPGAAAAALNMLRRGWTTAPGIAVDKSRNLVHRVVGPPGVVLVGEGPSANQLRVLLNAERTKTQRVMGDWPVHIVVCGDGDDEIPLAKLSQRIMKMKREVQPGEITDILNRLKALDATRGTLPIPKGPIPTSMKGMRGNTRGR
jgi:F0F1-type ATP synthase assembly protein I